MKTAVQMTRPFAAIPSSMRREDKDSCYLDFDRAQAAGDDALLAWAKHWGPYIAETFRAQPRWGEGPHTA